jgi:outer membrane protein W
MSIESKLVPTIQAGVSFALKDGWFIDAMVAKTFLKPAQPCRPVRRWT